MTEDRNELSPRDVAVALISEKIADVRARIEAHTAHARDAGDLYHSRILVFLEQCAYELKRAAVYLEYHDASEDEE